MATQDPMKVRQALEDLDVYPDDVAALAQLPYEQARQGLIVLKERARANLRRLMLELHPNRTGNDPAKTARLLLLSAIRDELEKVEVRAAAPSPQFHVRFVPRRWR